MEDSRWQRIQTLFHHAADLAPEERAAFLEAACGGDGALIGEVAAMLQEDSLSESLLDRGLAEAARGVRGTVASPLLFATDFGPYRIKKRIGEGGMGVVYLAEREDLGSLAAIKVLRDAWLSPARRERFLSEQRTLAQLNHPAIARLYDADTLADGTPWFAMEYVEGQPLTGYCRTRGAAIEERLQLLRRVCQAVEYAHAQAIIHRDLKPSNILVRSDGAVKLLDFGIAKQLDRLETADPTITGLRMMTPAYAPPEQIRGERAGVYSDVYSLGVILYELLAGRLPFDLSTCTPAQAEKMIAESVPQKPSAARALAASRSSWADLDVLCLTCMHKDVNRRYRSAEALVRDIDHYLNGEPLEARPDSVRYRLRKFVTRRKRAVAATVAAFTALAALVIFFTIRLAGARNAALAQASRAQRIQQFMLNLFDAGDSSAGPANNLRASTVVDRGVAEARALDREPAVQADLYATLGGIYQKLGNLDKADTLLKLALERRAAIFGSESREVAESLVAMGSLRMDQARLEEAERFVRDGLNLSRRTIPPGDPVLARAQTALGRVAEMRGDYKRAIVALEEAVRMQSGPASSPTDLAATLSELANTQFYQGNYAISDSLNRRVLAMHEQTYGERHPMVADDLINLAAIQTNLGHYAEAEALDWRALDINRSWYGNDHPETGASLNYVGQALVMLGRYREAEEMLQQSLAIQERAYGPAHPRVALALNELGLLAMRSGKPEEAVPRFRRALEIDRAVYGGRHQSVALESANLATAYLAEKQYARAERLFRQAIAQYQEILPAGHLNIGIAEVKLGRTLLRERRYSDAEAEMLAGYQIISRQASPSVTWLQQSRQDLVTLYEDTGHPEKAAPFRK